VRIAIHTNQIDGRGTGKVPFDYAVGLQNLHRHEVMFITSNRGQNEGLARLQQHFPVLTYDKRVDVDDSGEIRDTLAGLVDRHRIDFMHFLKYGHDDHVTPPNCRTGVHCVFVMTEPHGSVYAAVSESLARKFRHPRHVPHIVKSYAPTRDLRKELNLPADALVIGRHGGPDTFDLAFVHEAVREALDRRKNLHFVFLSTRKFHEHERITYLPWVESEQEKFNVIHACDAMLHARMAGETFGIAVGEFSAANKPVITWSGKGHPGYDVAHLDILGRKALPYDHKADLLNILLRLERTFILGRSWDVYSERFSEANVIRQYHDVFLHPGTS
jgi:glycosyltransferase involved in cell wall biosynthesis